MTRFAWLQARTQTLTVGAVLGVLAIAAAVTGVELSHLYDTQVVHCRTGCDLALNDYLGRDRFFQHALDILALVAPALLGIFWGAPLLSREFESGTHRLAWTQSVSRGRWLVTKLGLGAVTTAAAATLLTVTITWWYSGLDRVGSNQYDLFDRRDLVPVGYALFAFSVGALAGAVTRRTLPAMAATLGVYALARVAFDTWVRPNLLASWHQTVSLLDVKGIGLASSNGAPVRLVARASAGPNAWTQSSQIVTLTGHRTTSAQLAAFVQQHCPAFANPPSAPLPIDRPVKATPADAAAFESCRQQAARTYQVLVTYQPAGRYWTFQWLELGSFVALSLLALGGTYWWISRRAR